MGQSMSEIYELVVTCPWCQWDMVIEHDPASEVLVRSVGAAAARKHTKTAHPDIVLEPGAEPKIGFYRGEPLQ